MSLAGQRLARFVHALHRRNRLIRLVESIGVSVCAASVICLLIMPILIYRGDEVGRLLVGAFAVSVLTGIVLGAMRQPALLTTLMEADRQFKLHDLLSTAWVNRCKDEPWAQTVLALAERQVSQMRPRDLMLARLGSRAWAGIGLSVMLVMMLSLIPLMQPIEVAAGEEQRTADSRNGVFSSSSGESTGSSSEISREQAPDGRGESRDASRIDAEQAASGEDAKTRRSVDNGVGGGIGETSDRSQQTMSRIDATGQSTAGTIGQARGGAGLPGSTGTRGESSGSVTGTRSRHTVAPWQSPDWPAARQQAEQAVQAGQVPDAYRDLVRDYFDR